MPHAESDDFSVLSVVWVLFKLMLAICSLQSYSLITAYKFKAIVWPYVFFSFACILFFFTVQFQSVKYAIQSFISCQDGILYKRRPLIASNDLWEMVACLFLNWRKFVFTQWYRIIRTDRHGHILGLWSPTKVKRLHCMRFALLNSLKDKYGQTCSNSFTPSFPLSLHPSASRVHRSIISDQKAALQSAQYCEVEASFSLKLYCVLLYWFCVWAFLISKPNEKFMLGAPLSRSFCLLYIGMRFVSDNWCKNWDYTCISII